MKKSKLALYGKYKVQKVAPDMIKTHKYVTFLATNRKFEDFLLPGENGLDKTLIIFEDRRSYGDIIKGSHFIDGHF